MLPKTNTLKNTADYVFFLFLTAVSGIVMFFFFLAAFALVTVGAWSEKS